MQQSDLPNQPLVDIVEEPIDSSALIRKIQSASDGAVTAFLGVVRNHAGGRPVIRLEYFAYKSMALSQLQKLASECEERWDVRVGVIHRLGMLEIGEASVAIAVSSPHRGDAFEACRTVIERIKTDVPIWKKEYFEDGAVWVDPTPAHAKSPAQG